jgi:lysozyme
MQTNENGIDLIKKFEGLVLESYRDPVGIWTLGYGHIKGVSRGMKITKEEAESFLHQDLASAEAAVRRMVKTSLSSNEFSALVALAFNIGESAFADSVALKRINAQDRFGAADAIEWWNRALIQGRAVILPGLVQRRAAEKALFLEDDEQQEIQTRSLNGGEPDASDFDENSATMGLDSRITPIESPRNRRERLTDSRTMQGVGATAAAAVTAIGAGLAIRTHQANAFGETLVDYLRAYSTEMLITLGGLVFISAILIGFARWDDWRKGRR